MKRRLPIICTLLALCYGISSCHKSNENLHIVKNIYQVDGLLSFTGNWSTLGLDSRAAMNIAVTDINNYLAAENADFRMTVNFYDTKLDPATADADFNKSVAAGTHFIIGPQSSAELASIIPRADSNNVIVISQGSTAGSLGIAGDPVFRFCPPDKVEGAAISNTIYKAGIKGLVTLARNDAGNLGLQTAVNASFTTLGGTVVPLSAYAATNATAADFSAQVSQLHTQISQLVTTYGAANVGVYLASFDECTALFEAAANDPVLSSVNWYGGDGVALSAVLSGDAAAANFAIATNFYAPTFGLPESLQSKWQPIATEINSITNIQPDAFALASYDAMWVICHTLEASVGKNYTFSQLKYAFAAQSNAYIGITGSTALDANGDRASGTFDYYGLKLSGNTYTWTVVGESDK